MDKEDKILALMEKMYTDLSGRMDKMYTDLSRRMDKMHTDFDNRFKSVENKLDSIENRLDRVEFNQEKVHTDIQTIAEVQANHMAQNERQHHEIMETIEKRTTLIKEAVKHIAGETTMHTAELSLLRKQIG